MEIGYKQALVNESSWFDIVEQEKSLAHIGGLVNLVDFHGIIDRKSFAEIGPRSEVLAINRFITWLKKFIT